MNIVFDNLKNSPAATRETSLIENPPRNAAESTAANAAANAAESLDARLMRRAIAAAEFARELDEVPVGAVIVNADGEILASAGNRTRTDCDPTAHAEILALRKAAWVAGNYRLTDATIYSTLEPCAMCAGALIQARVKRLVYGTADKRFGAVHSKFAICDSDSLNHRIEIAANVLEDECRMLMQDFFRRRRDERLRIKNYELKITN